MELPVEIRDYLDSLTDVERCPVGWAADLHDGREKVGRPQHDRTMWRFAEAVEQRYDDLCEHFGTQRVNAAIRNRILGQPGPACTGLSAGDRVRTSAQRENDNLRAFREGMSFRTLCKKVRSGLLGRGFTLTPQPPKGPRRSGPVAWHEAIPQAEMALRDDGLLSLERCTGCGRRVIAASGELLRDSPTAVTGWCGACYRIELDARAGHDRLPAA